MTDKTRLFVLGYFKTKNATQSYIKAGYSVKGAGQSAAKLLKRVDVVAALALLKAQTEKKLLLDGEKFMNQLSAIGQFDPGEMFDAETGNVLHIKDMPAHVRAAISAVEFDKGTVSKVKTSSKLQALELYAKVTGMVKPPENDNKVQVIILPPPVGALVGQPDPQLPAPPATLLLKPEW